MNNQAYSTKRTFIAQSIPVSANFLETFATIRKELQGVNLKWVDPDNLHLTLAFLGDTTALQVEQIKSGLDDIVNRYPSFGIRIKGLGVFKNIHQPQVLWADIEADPTLGLLYRDIQELVTSVGFEGEKRGFKPHLTLGRIKSLREFNNLKEILNGYNYLVDETVQAKTVVYYESILRPAGSEYAVIKDYKLKH